MSDPSGIFIDPPSKKWFIGTRLGSGACGSVHTLQKVLKNSSSSTSALSSATSNYAVKVAQLPRNVSTNKKKKKSAIEKNADLLYHENTLYRNVFNQLRGHMIPDIPMIGYSARSSSSGSGSNVDGNTTSSIPPIGFGDLDEEGYRFFVMEKMQHPFHAIVPIVFDSILSSSSSSSCNNRIEIGIIASRLIDLIQAIHETQRLFVDVKPENFMLANENNDNNSNSNNNSNNNNKTKKKSKSSTKTKSIELATNIANRIRMIDFGLVETIRDASNNKHRVNSFPNGQMVGTPIYASLNVLSGHTVSRRDDLESIGYVIAELILQFMDCIRKKNNSNNAKKSTKVSRGGRRSSATNSSSSASSSIQLKDVNLDVLPWSNSGATSDDDIFTLKKNAMQSGSGVLWKLLNGVNNDDDDDDDNDDDNEEGMDTDSNTADVCEIMKEYFDLVMQLEYKEKPDYESLRSVLSNLRIDICLDKKVPVPVPVSMPKAKSSASTKSGSKKKSTSNRRVTRSRANDEENDMEHMEDDKDDDADDVDDEDVVEIASEATTHKRKTRTSRKAAGESEEITSKKVTMTTGKGKTRKKRITKTTVTTTEIIEIIETDDEVQENEEEDDDDLAEFVEAQDEMVEDEEEVEDGASNSNNDSDSDVDMVSVGEFAQDPSADASFLSCNSIELDMISNNENDASTSSRGNRRSVEDAKPPAKTHALKLECIEGCHKGLVLSLTGEMIIGQNPKRSSKGKKGQEIFEIEDEEASDLHAKLVLNKSGTKKKRLLTVRVTDMKSNNGTFVNGKQVTSSGKQAFVNDKIKVGDCVFCIRQS